MPDTHPRLLVACFCAAWCRTCDDYAHVVASLKVQYAPFADVAWLDIEDHADVLDEVDVENFPTLLVSDHHQVYFWGALLPHASTVTQLLDRVLSGKIQGITDTSITQLDQRLRATL